MTSLDFSEEGVRESTELLPSELFLLMSPDAQVSRTELDYLDSYSQTFLLISDKLSSDLLSLSYEDGRLDIAAEEHSYTAKNNASVRWIPTEAHIGGDTLPLERSESSYVATLEDIAREEGLEVKVSYSCTISLPTDTANLLLNFTYESALEAKRLFAEYEQYLESLIAYEEYLKQKESYDSYSERLAEYESELAAYNAYLEKLESYNLLLKKYQKYLADLAQFERDKAEYDRIYTESLGAIQEYNKYIVSLNTIRSAMEAMNSIYKSDGEHSPLFKAIQNKEMIAMFERYKDELSLFGIKPARIDYLSSVSDELTALLVEYDNARKISEKAAFEYYYANYDEISTKFNYLYDSMLEIMTPSIFVKIGAKLELDYKDPKMAAYKKWRVTNILCQIYLVCQCLDDKSTSSGHWEFYDYTGKERSYYFGELMAAELVIPDRNASSPKKLSWPKEAPEVVLPPIPTEPEKVTRPISPERVDEPIPPTPVTEPTPVEEPGEAPVGAESLLGSAEIVALLESGELTQRDEVTEPVSLTLVREISKPVSFDGLPVLTLYPTPDTCEQSIISSAADISLPTPPDRAPDRRRTYSFEAWSLSPDRLVEPTEQAIAAIDGDICIYALWSASERLYDISWNTPSGTFSEKLPWGALPVFDGNTDKPSTETEVYTFASWQPYPRPVSGDAEYTAQYHSAERKYEIRWQTHGSSATELYSFGERPTPPSSLTYLYVDGNYRYDLSGWNNTVSPVREDAEYTAIYTPTLLLSSTVGEADLTLDGNTYRASVPMGSCNVRNLLSLAAAQGKRVELCITDGDGVSLSIDKSSVALLAARNADSIYIAYEKNAETITKINLRVTDKRGSPLASEAEIRISLPYDVKIEQQFSVGMRSGNSSLELPFGITDGILTFVTNGNGDFTLKQLYSLRFAEFEGGSVITDKYLFEEGESITANVYPFADHYISLISVKIADTGEVFEYKSFAELKMPAANVILTVTFSKLTFTVTFVADGQVVSSKQYERGALPVPPKVPTEYEKDGYKYTFVGWTPAVVSVTGDATYTAKYNSSLITEPKSEPEGSAIDALIEQTVLPIAAVSISVVALLFLAIFLIKRRRKRK